IVMPPNTNGIETRPSVARTEARPERVRVGATGMARCRRKVSGIPAAKASALIASQPAVAAGPKVAGRDWTTSAPAVMPRSAAATARKAKWYHIVTLKIRVRRISYIRVAADTANTPAPTARGSIDGGTTGSLAGTLASLRHPGPGDRAIGRLRRGGRSRRIP